MKNKNPKSAGILKSIPGLDYLYLGSRKVFYYLLLLYIIVIFIDVIVNPTVETTDSPMVLMMGVLIIIAFIYDAFNRSTKILNKKSAKPKIKNNDSLIAAILNAIPGLGYLYLGKRKLFSYTLLLVLIIGVVDSLINPLPKPSTFLSLIGGVILLLAFIYDAYNEAKEISYKKGKKEKKKNPWLAGILNIIPGLGYLYIEKRKVFSYLLLLMVLISFIIGILYPNLEIIITPLFIGGSILTLFAFMYDSFNQSNEIFNKKTKKPKNKYPGLAAILNIIPGLGYLYLGKRKVFSYLLLIVTFMLIVGGIFNYWHITPLFIGEIIGTIAFMYDAYNEAKGKFR